MSENTNTNQRIKTPFNDYRYPHPKTKDPLPGAKYPAQALWDVSNPGKIIFKVSDGVFGGGDNSYKKKQQEIEGPERNAIFALLLEAARDPNFEKSVYSIKRKTFVREGGQSRMSDRPIVQAQFTVLRDKSTGVVSLGFSKSDFKALFVFDKPSDSELVDYINGEYVPATARMSRLYVEGYVGWISTPLTQLETEKYTPPKPRNSGNGNSGNGNYQSRQNQNSTPDFDDDMPDF